MHASRLKGQNPKDIIYEALLGVLGIIDNRKNNYGDKG